ncbi:MAG: nucleotidyltransferase domain-containing protein [Fuerstiella sp.]
MFRPIHKDDFLATLFDGFDALESAWRFSNLVTEDLKTAFRVLPEQVAAVVVCGSVKRMEAHARSDLDLMVVIDDRHQNVPQLQKTQIQDSVWEIVRQDSKLNALDAPMSGGLFTECASWKKLTDVRQRGVVDEDMTTFGHRMHVLMDGVAVSGADAFLRLQADVLEWYSEAELTSAYGGCPPFDWLKQDVLRYWHSLHARAYWVDRDKPAKSAIENLKLRTSRLLQVSAFLLRLRAVQKVPLGERLPALLESGSRSPLQTIVPLLTKADAHQLLSAWQNLWQVLEAGVPEDSDSSNWKASLVAVREQIEGLGFQLT